MSGAPPARTRRGPAAPVLPEQNQNQQRVSVTRQGSEASSRFGADNRVGSVFGSQFGNEVQEARLSAMARLNEVKKLSKEKKNYAVETGLDLFDFSVKTLVIVLFNISYVDDQEEFLPWMIIGYAFSVIVLVAGMWHRKAQLNEMSFVAANGYSKKWASKERVVGSGSREDPRIERDAADRLVQHQIFRSFQALLVDFSWLCINVTRGSIYELSIDGLLSLVVAGFGFGMKFSNIILLFKRGKNEKKVLYTEVPAIIRVGTGGSTDHDAEAAIVECYEKVRIGLNDNNPSMLLVNMTANMDMEKGLRKLQSLVEEGTPFSGCTICHGAMVGNKWVSDEQHATAIWAVYDPEGWYKNGFVDIPENPDEIEKTVSKAVMKTNKQRLISVDDSVSMKDLRKNRIFGDKICPSYVWVNPPPGPEDLVLSGISKSFIDQVDVIGGSSADNDVTGKWKQFCSDWDLQGQDKFHIRGNSCTYVVAYASAVVKGCAFTGYSPTPKTGTITEVGKHDNGQKNPRCLISIDNKPVHEVYNNWTSNFFSEQMSNTSEDSNILGPSSVYPLGQIVAHDHNNEPVYRTLHPHLFSPAKKYVTVFSDCKVDEDICMMTGTRDNIKNRISAVAQEVQKSANVSASQIKGALVVFCAGAMMYLNSEGEQNMHGACAKLSDSLGGANYIGIHTFGEQGPFPDGSNRHGNLMFSALVYTSVRKVMMLKNVDDATDVVQEGGEGPEQEKFQNIVMNDCIVGQG